MFSNLIMLALNNLLYFALHITGTGSFPKPLNSKDELECLIKIKEGDIEAKNKLIEHNLRLVAHIVKKYYTSLKDQEDLISIGTIGLIKAAGTFDYLKGTRFATYASRCIENEILMHFRSLKKTSLEVFISDPIDTDNEGNSLTLMDIVSEDRDIIDEIDIKIKTDWLYTVIDEILTKREKDIIVMRYGLLGTRPLTQREVAKKLAISRSYVSRIEKKSISLLRTRLQHLDN